MFASKYELTDELSYLNRLPYSIRESMTIQQAIQYLEEYLEEELLFIKLATEDIERHRRGEPLVTFKGFNIHSFVTFQRNQTQITVNRLRKDIATCKKQL